MRKYFIENISCSQKRGIFFILLDSASSRAKTKATAGIKRRYLETSSLTTTLLPFIAGEGMLLHGFLVTSTRHVKKKYIWNLQNLYQLIRIFSLFLILNLMLCWQWEMQVNLNSGFWKTICEMFCKLCEVIQTGLHMGKWTGNKKKNNFPE